MKLTRWNLFAFLLLFPYIFCIAKPQIYDCFLFFNELELLQIRLDEVYEHVDRIVLVEARESFRGKPKPLYYQENQHFFRNYADKIIHVVVNDHCPTNDCWTREQFQRNQISRGLQNCSHEDIILISDLDEIVRGTDIQKFIAPLIAHEKIAVSANQRFFRWYLNRQSNESWIGTIATTYQHLQQNTAEHLRRKRGEFYQFPDIGWHFSNMGGLNTYIAKIENFSHPEADTPQNKDPARIYQGVQQILQLVSIDSTFPRYIQNNQETLTKRGLIDFEGNRTYF